MIIVRIPDRWVPMVTHMRLRHQRLKIKQIGKKLGRPKGKLSSVTKLSGKDDLIRAYTLIKRSHKPFSMSTV